MSLLLNEGEGGADYMLFTRYGYSVPMLRGPSPLESLLLLSRNTVAFQ